MRATSIRLTLLTLLMLPGLALAAPGVGETLPRLVLAGEAAGRMTPVGDDVRYAPFDSAKHLAPGTVYLVTYLAARRGADKMGRALNAAMKPRPTSTRFAAVTVLNLDDCLFGTCGLARGAYEDHVLTRPKVLNVSDPDGKGRARWGAMEEGRSTWVLDHTGRIVIAVHGRIDAATAKRIRAAIDAAIAAAGG